MQIVRLTDQNHSEVIELACAALRKGGLVIYPTETTYGIGADCQNPAAIQTLLQYKAKRGDKPLSVAVADETMAEKYVELNETAETVYRTFLPGPVTVISRDKGVVATGVASSEGTLGIRIPKYPFVLEMIKTFGRGITATGANASYQKRPYSIQDIFDNISGKQKELISLVIDAGQLPHNEPSTVIDTTLDDIKVMRFGDIGFTQTEKLKAVNEAETVAFARKLILRYRSKLTYEPLVFALTGEMGAGKTHFTKGLAQGLMISDPITSPTYALANEYHFVSENRPGLLVHVDTWKIENLAQLQELKLEQYLAQNAVVVIEWADKFAKYIDSLKQQAKVIWVNLEPTEETGRLITVAHT